METRWGDIKQATNKFIGVHNAIVALNASRKTNDDRIQDAMELFRTKVGKLFHFKHGWFILQTYLRVMAIFKPMLKGKAMPTNRNDLPLDRSNNQPHVKALTQREAINAIRSLGSRTSKDEHTVSPIWCPDLNLISVTFTC